MTSLPLTVELPRHLSPVDAFKRLVDWPHCLFLDSARRHPTLGCYAYIAADPYAWLDEPPGAAEPLHRLGEHLAVCSSQQRADLPAFQGGAAGLLSYDLGRSFERLPEPRSDPLQLPALALGLYDVVVAFDLMAGRGWIVSQGWPAPDPESRQQRARSRLDAFAARLFAPERPALTPPTMHIPPLASGALWPLYRMSQVGPVEIYSNFTREAYFQAVRRAVEHVVAGDVFQVNLAQSLWLPARTESLSLYLHLRRENPATFAGYLDLGPYQILSASPERFLRVENRRVETRPIKGTRPRRLGPEADLYAGDELRESDKDRAENVMIVDLMRNDLSRVCLDDSVRVTQLCEIEHYEYVQHLVSAVQGTLRPECSSLDLLTATFPGGSITGAPKIRAMEIIAELEPQARGAYCGSLGYVNWNGAMDFSILIRTLTAGRGWWQVPVGGGIVAQSDAQREYDETWHKAEGMLRGIAAAVAAIDRHESTTKR